MARQCATLWRRIKQRPDGRTVIHVVTVGRMCEFWDRPTRDYSGIATLSQVPPVSVALFLSHELLAGIPRAAMGKAVFDLMSKFYRIASRHLGVPRQLGVSDYLVIHADISNAQVALLMKDRAEAPIPNNSYGNSDGSPRGNI